MATFQQGVRPRSDRLQTGTQHINIVVNRSELATYSESDLPSLYTAVSGNAGHPTKSALQQAVSDDVFGWKHPYFQATQGMPVFRLIGHEKATWNVGKLGSHAMPIQANLNVLRLNGTQAKEVQRNPSDEVQARIARELEERVTWGGIVDQVDTREDSGRGYSTALVAGPRRLRWNSPTRGYAGDRVEWAIPTPASLLQTTLDDDIKRGIFPILTIQPVKQHEDSAASVLATANAVVPLLRDFMAKVKDADDTPTNIAKVMNGEIVEYGLKAGGKDEISLHKFSSNGQKLLQMVYSMREVLKPNTTGRELVTAVEQLIQSTSSKLTRLLRAMKAVVQHQERKMVGFLLNDSKEGEDADILFVPNMMQ